MLDKEELIINQIAQNQISFEEGLEWFAELDHSNQVQTIISTQFYLAQSHPSKELIENTASTFDIKHSNIFGFLKNKRFKTSRKEITESNSKKLKQIFLILITLFKKSDTVRREKWCKDGCNHYWHNLL